MHIERITYTTSPQDATCRSTHCEAAYRCWEDRLFRCCWPPENDDECQRPGVPYGWSAPGHDPASVSNNESPGAAENGT